MKKVAIVGAGLMTQPLVDYFIDNCGYQVIVVNRTFAKAEKVIEGRTADDPEVIVLRRSDYDRQEDISL
jgi:glutamyl-tRNA reductase